MVHFHFHLSTWTNQFTSMNSSLRITKIQFRSNVLNSVSTGSTHESLFRVYWMISLDESAWHYVVLWLMTLQYKMYIVTIGYGITYKISRPLVDPSHNIYIYIIYWPHIGTSLWIFYRDTRTDDIVILTQSSIFLKGRELSVGGHPALSRTIPVPWRKFLKRRELSMKGHPAFWWTIPVSLRQTWNF